MSSEDVIELGSSDDDAEPASKKKKSLPNIMVHIPTTLPGITIKPTKSVKAPITEGLTIKPVIMNNFDLKTNSVNKAKVYSSGIKVLNGPTIKTPQNMNRQQIRNVKSNFKTVSFINNKLSINPFSVAKNLNNISVQKVPPVTIKKVVTKGPKVLNNLPPSITVKPVNKGNFTRTPIHKAGSSGLIKRGRLNGPKLQAQEMLTVEIDDEDSSELTKDCPQWYMPPEDQKAEEQDNANMELDFVETSMEEKNNKEPNKTTYVEITIEDSPLKSLPPSVPILCKHPDIGKELSITIEDSPVKTISSVKEVESDGESIEMPEKQSKKKLDYPIQSKNNVGNNIVEIEIDFGETNMIVNSEEASKFDTLTHKSDEATKTSPIQNSANAKINNSKEEEITESISTQNKEIIVEYQEFHSTYQKFIQLCFQLEDTDDMKKIVDKKIKAYYRQCPKEYVESEEFVDMVSSKINLMKASPDKMYLYIKDIVDELNLQRKMTKSVVPIKTVVENEQLSDKYEGSQYDSKKQRQIRKLEKTIKKLHRAIQKLEEQEVDFDDDEDSVYLLTERYKERMVRVHAKFCQLTNTKMPSEPRIHIDARPGRSAAPAKKLEKWINRKVPIGTPLPFPDFHDVIRCVREANEEEKLGWNDIDVMEEARDLFTRCGKKLQRRRQENEWRQAASRISAGEDPAENSLDLKKKLDDNKIIAAKKETELLNKYVDRQNLLKLEAEEIGDKEAEESPVESEEEDVGENDNSMKDKQKRTQRLKRLIQEKSKKDEDKESARNEEKTNENKLEESNHIEEDKNDNATIESKSNNDNIVDQLEAKPHDSEAADKGPDCDSIQEVKEYDDSDTNRVESDIDELHLLQKLHSENEANTSTSESSDSDTPIAISDTIESDSEDNVSKYDVISIEDSSYSESEMIIDVPPKSNKSSLKNQNIESLITTTCEIEYSSSGIVERFNEETYIQKVMKKATEVEVEENILLASSDEEMKDKVDNNVELETVCINLRDDNISISETTVDGEENVKLHDENIIPENNNAVEFVEESPRMEDNCDSLEMIQDNIDDDNVCKNINKEHSELVAVMNYSIDSPKDIVDIRSASDVNSVDSTDSQTYKENKSDRCDYIDINIESNSNEKSETSKDTANSDTQNLLEKDTCGQSITTAISDNGDVNMDIEYLESNLI